MQQEILAGDKKNHGLNMVTDGKNANEKQMGVGTEQRGNLIFIYVNRMLYKEKKNCVCPCVVSKLYRMGQ